MILFFILMGVVGYGIGKNPEMFASPEPTTFPKAVLKLPQEVSAVPPLAMEQTLADAYRLKPDRRFLIAIEKTHLLIAGTVGKADSQFEKDHWTLLHNGKAIGQVPEFPDFPDLLKVLKGWARQLSDSHPSFLNDGTALDKEFKLRFELALGDFQPNQLAHHLQTLNAYFEDGTRRVELLVFAARALSVLAFNLLDTLEVSDEVPAQALALLAAAQELAGEELIKAEAQLAELMQYSTHAQKRVQQLPVSDGLRQYVLQDTPALKVLAEQEHSDWETRYLYLLRLAKSGKISEWEDWFSDGFPHLQDDPLALYKTSLIIDSFSDNNYYARQVRLLIQDELKVEQEGMPSESAVGEFFEELSALSEIAQLFGELKNISDDAIELKEFESSLEGLGDLYTGPFLDASTYQSFFRGHFYSTLHTDGHQYLDRLSSTEEAEQFLKETGASLGEGQNIFQKWFGGNAEPENAGGQASHSVSRNWTADERSQDFYRWFSFWIGTAKRKVQPIQILDIMAGMPTLGGEPLHKVYDEARGFIPFNHPAKYRLLKRLVARLDSRMAHREHMRMLALDELYDLELTERIARSLSVSGAGHYPFQKNWYLKFIGDSKSLLKTLRSGKGTVKSRIWILDFLEDLKMLKDRTLIREYHKLVKEDPEDWYVRKPFINFLMRKKHYTEARKQALDWLERDVEVTGLEKIIAQNFVAESLLEQKKYHQAYKAISKVVKGYQGKSLRLAGQILDKLDQPGKAEAMFGKAIKRYPGSYKQTQAMVNFLWGRGRYDDARDTVFRFPGGLAMQNWRSDMARGFYHTFKARPEKEAEAAFDSLLTGPNVSPAALAYIPGTLHNGKYSRLAFKLQSKLQGQKSQQLMFEVKGYEFLKAWKGERAALKWLKSKNPARFGMHSANVFFEKKKFPLLWDMIPGNPGPQVWLLRAAGSLRSKPTAAQRRALLKYFRKNDPTSTRNQLGRYLLGKISEEDLLRQADDPVKRLEFAFYIGWKARAQGDWYKAARWLRIALETGQRGHWEYGWAGNLLFHWQDESFALSYLKKHPELD